MQIIETKLAGCFIIEPRVFGDERGYFFESFNKDTFKKETGLAIEFVQDNESYSNYGVVRGLHMQMGEWAQAKLVRVVQGKVIDVAVDVRPNSPTYGEHIAVELSGANKRQLFVPRGFAHGFSVLEDGTQFLYKCDNVYNKSSEAGINLADPHLNIDWGVPQEAWIVSEKDVILPNLK